MDESRMGTHTFHGLTARSLLRGGGGGGHTGLVHTKKGTNPISIPEAVRGYEKVAIICGLWLRRRLQWRAADGALVDAGEGVRWRARYISSSRVGGQGGAEVPQGVFDPG